MQNVNYKTALYSNFLSQLQILVVYIAPTDKLSSKQQEENLLWIIF